MLFCKSGASKQMKVSMFPLLGRGKKRERSNTEKTKKKKMNWIGCCEKKERERHVPCGAVLYSTVHVKVA